MDKQIRITEDAYSELLTLKSGNESISDIIKRVVNFYKVVKLLVGSTK